MTFEEVVREGRERVERQSARNLIIKTCVVVIVETREERVRADAFDLLRRVIIGRPTLNVRRSGIG